MEEAFLASGKLEKILITLCMLSFIKNYSNCSKFLYNFSHKMTYANSADPDLKEQSDQRLHYLHQCMEQMHKNKTNKNQ